MKSLIKLILLCSMAFLMLAVLSCNKGKDPDTQEYLIYIDSIQLADTVQLGQSFEVLFYGVIGPDGCSSFNRFEYQSAGHHATVMAVGHRKVSANLACPEYLPVLDGKQLQLQADTAGIFTIDVINPGINNVLRQTIVVVP